MRKAITPVLVALVLILALVVGVNGQGFFTTLENVWAESLITTKGVTVGTDLAVAGTTALTGNTTVGGIIAADTAAVTSNATVGGILSVNGSGLNVAGTMAIVPRTALTVTDAGTITPTGTFQLLTAAGTVGADLGTPTSGAIVTFLNIANQTITISDTTGSVLAGNAALGQWDTLTVIGYGNAWHEIARANN